MNKISIQIVGALLAGAALGAGGLYAARGGAAPDTAPATDAQAPAREAALAAENRELKLKYAALEEQLLLSEAALREARETPMAALPEAPPEAPEMSLEDLFAAMEWDEAEPEPRGRRGRGTPDDGDTPRGEGPPWARDWSPEDRAERFGRMERAMQEGRERLHDFLAQEAAVSGDAVVQERLGALAGYVDHMQALRQEMRDAEDPETRDALRDELREAQRTTRNLLRDQQQHLLEQAAANAGLGAREQRQLANQVRDAMESPYFRLETMLGGGPRGGGRWGGGPPR